MKKLIPLLLAILVNSTSAQDFFDDNSEGSMQSKPYELNGFIRGVFFGGSVVEQKGSEMKSGYGELGLKIRARKGQWGDGYADIRFRQGSEFNQFLSEFNLREAYVNTYIGHFDLRLGQQIVVWGRADGFNPTNNITPQNMLARSPDEDDRKEGNFLIRAFYHLHPVKLEFIWVPRYQPSVLPTELFPFPQGVRIGGAIHPDANLKNSSIAIKMDIGLSSFDGSLSYFQGYMPLPGISLPLSSIAYSPGQGLEATVFTKSYEMRVVGFDYSTTMGSFGLRGEIAYRESIEDYQSPTNMSNIDLPSLSGLGPDDNLDYILNPDIQYVFGIDKTSGDFSIIIQYIGRVVLDFKNFEATGTPLDELYQKNRMIAAQMDKISHAVFMRPALAMSHETMGIELMGYFNLTTEEILLRPVFTYDIADELELRVGGEVYRGPENTLFGTIDESLSSIFIELRTSF